MGVEFEGQGQGVTITSIAGGTGNKRIVESRIRGRKENGRRLGGR